MSLFPLVKKSHPVSATPCLRTVLAALVFAAGLAAGGPVDVKPQIVNGDFESAVGWTLSAGATIERDGKHGGVLVLLSVPGRDAKAAQDVVCDPSWGTLRFSYMVSVPAIKPGKESWQNVRITLVAYDAAGKVKYLDAGSWPTPTKGWIAGSSVVALPAGTVRLRVSPAVLGAIGEMRLDDLAIALLTRRGEAIDAKPPSDQTPQWGQEPIETNGSFRGTMCLNGVWRFMPASGPATQAPLATGWGWQRVPGAWEPRRVADGLGDAWVDFGRDTSVGWYERDLAVPAAWASRAILLDLRRVSTDAAVWIDGHEAGRVAWPRGEVDLTALVTPGRTHQLRIKVVGTASAGEVTRYMGQAEGQVFKEKARLDVRGLIGDVLLTCRPTGAHLTDCAIRTSVRKHELAIETTYAALGQAGSVKLTAVVRDGEGREARRFTTDVSAPAGDGSVCAAWRWDDPVLWDLDHPQVYTLELSANGAGIDDGLVETFGFREFRIDGRHCFLNEREIHLRPSPIHSESGATGIREFVNSTLSGLLRNGFNAYEMWPWNRDERGKIAFDEMWCQEADQLGILLFAPALDMGGLVDDWAKPGVADTWEKRMQADMRSLRNHPSVIMWTTTGNRFGHGQDQNPAVMGRSSDPDDLLYRRNAAIGRDALARIRRFDPTRPVFSHASAAVGDVFTMNCYLNLIPLQEREEWPSQWAASGDMPLIPVEFGTPLSTSFHRGRAGYGNAEISEPLYTEYCAIYQGPEAYRTETQEYRHILADTFQSGQVWKTWHGIEQERFQPAFVHLEALFLANTWRSWRTWGVTGMLPWSYGYAWLRKNPTPPAKTMSPVAFEPGRRGMWRPLAPDNLLRFLDSSALTEAGRALVANNQATLAWIAGAADDPAGFTDKTHHYRAGMRLTKQAALINDDREPRTFRLHWSVIVADHEIAKGDADGTLDPGQIRLLPIVDDLPAIAADRADGMIRLEAAIGDAKHQDEFAFRVYRPLVPAGSSVAILDPLGETAAMLKALGVATRPWDGAAGGLLVVGRRALSDGGVDPARVEAFVRAGGRALVMAQNPQWMRNCLGVRVARQLSRRVFPVIEGHPALAGLTADELRDWAGVSRLVPPVDLAKSDGWQCPPYGWRWGARHVLTSDAIEVPQRAGWRPLLRCEFDGAYTPLAQVALGAGTVVLCTLDLEDHVTADPAAERLARAILAWSATVPAEPRLSTVYMGNDAGEALVSTLGIRHERAQALPEHGLALIAGDAQVADADLDAFLKRGGHALMLATRREHGLLGVTFSHVDAFCGSLMVPAWPECAGLWPGELRRRADGPAWLVTGGAEIGADGLLAQVRRGDGVALFCQLDPDALDVEHLTWNRLTRWRHARGIAQLAANLGAELAYDGRLLEPVIPDQVDLNDAWKAAFTTRISVTPANMPRPKDPGPSAAALALVRPDADESGMQAVSVCKDYKSYGEAWANADGELVFRRTVEIPARWAGKDLALSLGLLDDYDTTYFDGVAVGSTDETVKNTWSLPRRYVIPGRLVTPGRHVLAIRIYNNFGGGGMTGNPQQLFITPAQAVVKPPEPAYLPGWREDAALGDDPYRYYRW